MHVPATPLFSGIYTDFSAAIFHSGDILRARPRRSHLPPQGIQHALIVIEILSPGHGVGGSFRHPRDATLDPPDRHLTIRLTSSRATSADHFLDVVGHGSNPEQIKLVGWKQTEVISIAAARCSQLSLEEVLREFGTKLPGNSTISEECVVLRSSECDVRICSRAYPRPC